MDAHQVVTGYVRKQGGEMTRALPIEVYRSPWWLLFILGGGLVGAIITSVILEGGLELSRLSRFYIGWALGVTIVWIVIRKTSAKGK